MILRSKSKGIVSIIGLLLTLVAISALVYFITRSLVGNNSEDLKSPIERAEDVETQVDDRNQEVEKVINDIEEDK